MNIWCSQPAVEILCHNGRVTALDVYRDYMATAGKSDILSYFSPGEILKENICAQGTVTEIISYT